MRLCWGLNALLDSTSAVIGDRVEGIQQNTIAGYIRADGERNADKIINQSKELNSKETQQSLKNCVSRNLFGLT